MQWMMKWLLSFSGDVGGISTALTSVHTHSLIALVEASKHRQIGHEQAACSLPFRFGVLGGDALT